jgi:hypothetical protein
MPAKLSDDDTRALIAYIRKLPPAGAATPDPPDRFNFIGLVMLGIGQFPSGKPVNTNVVTAPIKAPTIQNTFCPIRTAGNATANS